MSSRWRLLGALGEHALDDVGRLLGADLELLEEVALELAQHVVCDLHFSGRPADTELDAREVAAAELVGDGAKSVVGVQAAAELDLYLSRRQVDLIVYDEDLLRLKVMVSPALIWASAPGSSTA